MTVLNAHFDKGMLVVDDPIPADIPANARARVIVESQGPCKAFEEIAKLAIDADLPPDYSENHDKYLYGVKGK